MEVGGRKLDVCVRHEWQGLSDRAENWSGKVRIGQRDVDDW